ncbi:MAG: N-carbamoylputrescine amidase [Deltaproteobacteria bacterium]|nr:N-carbamoylputrescine amidase [Deltaproteobacteria bacterium]MBW1874119.1 N-carbamoylputrescine amidase [Deltaproteobacteria bacterium]MBW2209691.1 N-carbamoylputrescine amidase [Deltaproteobacteria bacterium]MBW2212867.1 N-carbamoylputrescine amidase [Deltaproteobacteria bacterium]MBW2379659.1 N-carbamoylputrescine amidase [Deltaproteobacteria bacterium]
MTSSSLSIGIVQCALGGTRDENVSRVETLIREAANRGAQIVLTPELFEGPYFPQTEDERAFDLAAPLDGHPTVARMRALAANLGVVLPISFFERAGQGYYNSLVTIDADGTPLGVYRKSHIPDGPGYEEKFYFRPGDTGFKVWKTGHGSVGVGICWDQWFPEAARSMALQGAEVLLYPTAIGTEPDAPDDDTRKPWQRVMIGHAVANAMPVAAANRIGTEGGLTFYGSSFVCDERGDMTVELDQEEEGVAIAVFDREALRRYRANWGFFRDRRPELYGRLTGDEPVD